ncbi:MAG: tetratricopeptide repeat protein, partial [Nitrospirae bacterium]|nr:tetratricopeptide repeat protein [Nitrospirota bacterium]
QEAISEFQKVVGLKKDFYAVHVDLGSAYIDLGERSKAEEELSFLNDRAPDLASLLNAYMDKTTKPKILSAYNVSGFTDSRGPGTPVSELDGSLSTPGASRQFNMVFLFTKEMDAASVQNPYNWSITKAAYGSVGGAYNWGLPTSPTDITIDPVPVSVISLPGSLSATVSFMINQNAGADGTIDPSHIKFKFKGKDLYGNTMDASADEYSGISKIV